MNASGPNIWQKSGGAYSQSRPHQLAFFTPAESARYERLRQGKLLFAGQHREYFLDEERTQFNFPEVKAQGRVIRLYAMWNVLGLISNKFADLLFKEKPSIRVDDKAAQALIDGIVDRSGLAPSLLDAAVEASWAGETFLEISRVGAQAGAAAGLAYISHVPAEELYPVGVMNAARQFNEYVRYATALATPSIAGRPTELMLLLETRYTAGAITRRCFKLKQGPGGFSRDGEISIDVWPAKRADGSSPPAEEMTGLSRPSIVWIPNQLIGGCVVSDYDGLIDQQDQLNAKHTQVTRVLAKHSDPKLRVPRSAADENGNFPSDHDVVFGEEGAQSDGGYGYITWDAKLDAAHKDRAFALHALCTQAECPASLLGLEESGADDSARKVRLKATPALAKAGRKAAYWQGGIALAVSIAVEAETGAIPAVAIGVEMRDGLPVDELDRANVISTLRSSESLSRRRSLVMQGLGPAEIEDELSELEKDDKAKTPSVLIGEPGEMTDEYAAESAAA